MNGVKNKLDKSAPMHQMWQQYSNGTGNPGFVQGTPTINTQMSQRMLEPIQDANVLTNGVGQAPKPTTPSLISPNPLLSAFADPPAQQSWNDIRREFEDEFLL